MAGTIRTPLPVYTTGTVAGNAGQPVLAGTNTSWIAADAGGNPVNTVMGGDLFIAGDRAIPIRSVDMATQITLECPLPQTINAGSAYRIIKVSPNLSGGVTNALAQVLAYGTDASPEASLAVDNGGGRLKLRIGAAGDLQLAVGAPGAQDAALVTALDIGQGGQVLFPNSLDSFRYGRAINTNSTTAAAGGLQAMIAYAQGIGGSAASDIVRAATLCVPAPPGGYFEVSLVTRWLQDAVASGGLGLSATTSPTVAATIAALRSAALGFAP